MWIDLKLKCIEKQSLDCTIDDDSIDSGKVSNNLASSGSKE